MAKQFSRESAWHNLHHRTVQLMGAVGIKEDLGHVECFDLPDTYYCPQFEAHRYSEDISLPNQQSVSFEVFGSKSIILSKRFAAWRALKNPLSLTAMHTVPESNTSPYHHTYFTHITHLLSSKEEYLDYEDILSAAEESVNERPELYQGI